jgi:hypothetical protein
MADRKELIFALQEERLAPAVEQLEQLEARLGRHVVAGRCAREHLAQLIDRPIDPLLENRQQNLLLALEVPVEGALREACPLDHLVDGARPIAALGNECSGGVEEQATGVLAILFGGSRPSSGTLGLDRHGALVYSIDQPVY